MLYKFKNAEDFYTILKKEFALKEIKENNVIKYILDGKKGRGYIERNILKNGIEICIFDIVLYKDLKFSCQIEEQYFEFNNFRNGKMAYVSGTECYNYNSMTEEIIFSQNLGSHNEVEFKKNVPCKSINIIFTKVFIDAIVSTYGNEAETFIMNLNQYAQINNIGVMGNKMKYLFLEILSCKQQGLARSITLESIALQLMGVFLELSKEWDFNLDDKIYMSENDITQIIYASKLIEEHLVTPLSISELSNRININSYKLKVGFKKIFKTTMFDYLREKRVEYAVRQLENTEKSIMSIAQEVGYSNPSNFANIFKKKIGISPSDYRSRYQKYL
ncbi:MAG: AraC family transcriptional regulator [Clostridia bacterium]|nr:AraC family transcriptional regulator [Clostridia bacterium]